MARLSVILLVLSLAASCVPRVPGNVPSRAVDEARSFSFVTLGLALCVDLRPDGTARLSAEEGRVAREIIMLRGTYSVAASGDVVLSWARRWVNDREVAAPRMTSRGHLDETGLSLWWTERRASATPRRWTLMPQAPTKWAQGGE